MDLFESFGVFIIPILYFLFTGLTRKAKKESMDRDRESKPWVNPWDEEEQMEEEVGEPRKAREEMNPSMTRSAPEVAPIGGPFRAMASENGEPLVAPVRRKKTRKPPEILGKPMEREEWKRAFILKELLDEPVSRRSRFKRAQRR